MKNTRYPADKRIPMAKRSFLTAQTVVEYTVIFLVLAGMIIIVFGSFNPEQIRTRNIFNRTVNRAIHQLNTQ